MNKNLALAEFAKTLAGVYDNIEQSQKDPKDFAHINIFFRPLPWDVLKAPGFYSEQSYDHDPWRPYRQGIHRLTPAMKILSSLRTMDSLIPEDWLVQVEIPKS